MYFGTSSGDYDYENPVDLGNVTSQVFPNVTESVYYLAITAYNSKRHRDGNTQGAYDLQTKNHSKTSGFFR